MIRSMMIPTLKNETVECDNNSNLNIALESPNADIKNNILPTIPYTLRTGKNVNYGNDFPLDVDNFATTKPVSYFSSESSNKITSSYKDTDSSDPEDLSRQRLGYKTQRKPKFDGKNVAIKQSSRINSISIPKDDISLSICSDSEKSESVKDSVIPLVKKVNT
ncbi:hypothetical protein QE152_g5289 [Popillia japonica]|uniref:Exophilin 5 n=1 Tax=Popillia japonica TaxID=7064 RepID=A0AAW1MP85_POPJA